MSQPSEIGILIVCMGNICRSPTAHGVLRARVAAAGLEDRVRIDSAGTHGYHIGAAPDRRALAAAAERGYNLADLRARQVRLEDFDLYDHILAMDRANLDALDSMAQRHGHTRGRVALFMEYASEATGAEVPDPYYGGTNGFERVLDMVEMGADGLIRHLRQI